MTTKTEDIIKHQTEVAREHFSGWDVETSTGLVWSIIGEIKDGEQPIAVGMTKEDMVFVFKTNAGESYLNKDEVDRYREMEDDWVLDDVMLMELVEGNIVMNEEVVNDFTKEFISEVKDTFANFVEKF